MVKTISDKIAKEKCKKWLGINGFKDIESSKEGGCDLIARQGSKKYYIEIKYSSKSHGRFFGTVMLTEMFKAISNRNNYLFLVCRGKGRNINNWKFKLFNVKDFLKCSTLTTPIFLYHIDTKDHINFSIPSFRSGTVTASENLIKTMWFDFQRWKKGYKN